MPLASHPPLPVPRRHSAARRLLAPRRGWSFCALLVLACSGPKTATPVPEPPVIDVTQVAPGVRPLTADDVVGLVGSPGAAPGSTAVRATNLDSALAVVQARVAPDGSFSIEVELPDGSEVRLQPVAADGVRGEPVDWVRIEQQLQPAARHECVLASHRALAFEGSRSQVLSFTNQCTVAATLALPRLRRGVIGDSVDEALFPLVLEPGVTGRVPITFAATDPAEPEDVFFVDISVDGEIRRHATTLFEP